MTLSPPEGNQAEQLEDAGLCRPAEPARRDVCEQALRSDPWEQSVTHCFSAQEIADARGFTNFGCPARPHDGASACENGRPVQTNLRFDDIISIFLVVSLRSRWHVYPVACCGAVGSAGSAVYQIHSLRFEGQWIVPTGVV